MGGETPVSFKGRIARVSEVLVPVSDIEGAIEFYRDLLEMSIGNDDRVHDWIEMVPKDGGTRIVLYRPSKGDPKQPGVRTGIVLSTDSIYDLHKVLVDEGVEFTLKPERDKKGRLTARFVDDDHNEIEVLEEAATGAR